MQLLKIKQVLFTNWTIRRALFTGTALFIIGTAIYNADALSGAFGAVVLLQALTNTGCVGSACGLPSSTTLKQQNHE